MVRYLVSAGSNRPLEFAALDDLSEKPDWFVEGLRVALDGEVLVSVRLAIIDRFLAALVRVANSHSEPT